MGKLWSRAKRRDNEGNNTNNSLSESDESTDDGSSDKGDSDTPDRRSRKVKKEEPTDGWEEICGIDVDVLEDVMMTKKHKIRHRGRYISDNSIKIPTIEENRERLSSAYNLWLKYCPENCQVFMPKWERILEKPVLEQSVLVDEYVRKVFYLLQLEDVPDYNIPDDIPKGEVLIRDPNKPGTFIKLRDALQQKEQRLKKNTTDLDMEVFSNIPSSSNFKGHASNENFKLLKRNHPHHTV